MKNLKQFTKFAIESKKKIAKIKGGTGCGKEWHNQDPPTGIGPAIGYTTMAIGEEDGGLELLGATGDNGRDGTYY